MNRKETIEGILYDWKQIEKAQKKTNKIWKSRFKKLTDEELEEFANEIRRQLEGVDEEFNIAIEEEADE
jgi:hypothetical protein